jgi:hypothetical protein
VSVCIAGSASASTLPDISTNSADVVATEEGHVAQQGDQAAPSGTEDSEATAPGETPTSRDSDLEAAQSEGDEDEVEAAGDDRDCADFSTQEEAQDYFEDQGGSASNNVDNLDADSDGIACESLPSSSAPSGGVDTGGGGTAPRPPGSSASPTTGVLGGAALGFGIGLLLIGLRRRPSV